MNNAAFSFQPPVNEPVRSYAPGTPERERLTAELTRQASEVVEIPAIIDGGDVYSGDVVEVVMPTEHGHVLARCHLAGEAELEAACDAAVRAQAQWSALSWIERASIQLKAAELLAGRHRDRINAATMLGQGKNAHQSEIDAAAETIDFLRYNAMFASQIYAQQPRSALDQLNRLEYRPLEGFVLAISPFNFTSIASNLTNSPVLMGNTVVWKPATTAVLSNYHLMRVLQEAGMPPGVVNFVPSAGARLGRVALARPELAGIHFTGSNGTFNTLWRQVAANLDRYRSYPRLVGETGGKDFVFVHASADPVEVATALVRGAFEYQGQKCSAASRAYVPRSLWPDVRESLVAQLSRVSVGDVRDLSHFMNAVIDATSYRNLTAVIAKARADAGNRLIFGGGASDAVGWFVEPTVLEVSDPRSFLMQEEFFGPILSVFVYEDAAYEETLQICDRTSPYGLTGAVFSRDRYAFVRACQILRYAAGNFYLNDKPTGAMVGLQPFGGARGSGTNDKAGGPFNLMRWISPRTIKETFVPATSFEYPFMGR